MNIELKSDEYSGGNVNFIDVASAIAESWKYVLFIPIFISLIAFGVTRLLPKVYESSSSVSLPTSYIAGVKDPVILDGIAREMGFLAKDGGSLALARGEVAASYSFQREAEGRYLAKFQADTPERAKQLGDLVFKGIFEANQPRDYNRQRLEQRLQNWTETREKYLAAARALSVAEAGVRMIDGTGGPEIVSREFSAIIEGARGASEQIADLQHQLRGLQTEAFIYPPELPERPISTGPLKMAISVFIISAVVLSLAIAFAEVMQQFWGRAGNTRHRRFVRAIGMGARQAG